MREMTHSPAPPMPKISSLLGSPFSSRKPLPSEFSIASPTWNHGKDDATAHLGAGWDDSASSPMDMAGAPSPALSKSQHYPSTDDGSGSCTSASSSSMLSPEFKLGSSARPALAGLWSDDCFDDDTPPPSARANLFGSLSVRRKKSAVRLEPLYSPGPRSPLVMSCTSFPSSPGSSPAQPKLLSASTSAVEGHLRSPAPDYFSRKPQSCRKRSTAERFGSSPHELFLSQCNGRSFELTPRPDGPRTPSGPRSDDIAASDHSPLPNNTTGLHALPLSPSAPSLSRTDRSDSLQVHLTPRNRTPATVARSKSIRVQSAPTRPALRRGLTDPSVKTPKAPPIPKLGTPVSELFGDDKPSPAAFSSSGLVKKRGARLNLPRFQARMREPPLPPSFEDKPKRPVVQRSKTNDPPVGSDTETEDSDEDQLSPIKPLRSGPFRMSMNSTHSHSRNGSLASDITSSPFRRSHGHTRMSSTASSVGGSKGLRRKSSAMFTSAGSIASDTELAPATPTKPLPLACE